MLQSNRFLLLLLILLASHSAGFADERLDRIVEELQSLREQVSALEARVSELESLPPAETHVETTQPRQSSREKSKWFDTMRVELKKAEARASGAWTSIARWDRIHKGMKVEDVVHILGEPTHRKFSVRKDTDEILIYEGDLDGNGELVSGEIRIYKGKVRRYVAPDLPPE